MSQSQKSHKIQSISVAILNLTRGDNEKSHVADEQRKLRPTRKVVNDTAEQRAERVSRVGIYGFKQRNARTNPETSDTGQTHLSTPEPINVRRTGDVSERANVNYDNSSGPSGNDATDDSGVNETETDRSSERERNSNNNGCLPNIENGCDDMCCENFKKLTGACLHIMIEMLAKASVEMNSDVGLQSTAKKKVELMMQQGVT